MSCDQRAISTAATACQAQIRDKWGKGARRRHGDNRGDCGVSGVVFSLHFPATQSLRACQAAWSMSRAGSCTKNIHLAKSICNQAAPQGERYIQQPCRANTHSRRVCARSDFSSARPPSNLQQQGTSSSIAGCNSLRRRQAQRRSETLRLSPNSFLHIDRSFLLRAYPTMKKNNPNTPIMLRDAAGTVPRVYARYGKVINLLRPGSSWL
jgi:hypothetical protein